MKRAVGERRWTRGFAARGRDLCDATQRTSALVACAWLLNATSACGSDAEAAASGAPEETRVAELAVDDLRSFCEWLYDQEQRRSISGECTALVAPDVATERECEARRSTCIAERTPLLEARIARDRAACERLTAPPDSDACGSTVGEVEQCARDMVASQLAYVRKFSCQQPGRFLGDWYPPATCETVSSGCFLAAEPSSEP